jgi:hypothetical protein
MWISGVNIPKKYLSSEADLLESSGVKVISAMNLTKRYGGIIAADDISFEIEPGRIPGLLGMLVVYAVILIAATIVIRRRDA